MKNNDCFNCLHHDNDNGGIAENKGWYHPCKLNVDNDGLQDVKSCEKYAPNKGFQIGGYYTHMHFEHIEGQIDKCLNWVIHSEGEFPTSDEKEQIVFHICNFKQIEEWVKFWGEHLRKEGIIKDEIKFINNGKTTEE